MKLLTYLGPWCCEKGRELGVQVCPECEKLNQLWSKCLGISDEEWQARANGKPFIMLLHSDGTSTYIPPEEFYLPSGLNQSSN